MKTFPKRLLIVVAAGAAWKLRASLTRRPATTTATPNPQSPSNAQQATVARPADNLTAIKGVGPAFSAKLTAAGIVSFAQLATIDIDAVSATTDISANQLASWASQAAQMT